MVEPEKSGFDAAAFLASAGLGRRIIRLAPKDAFFSQGDPADSIFYLQSGRARVTVVSAAGKEATITLLASGDFTIRFNIGQRGRSAKISCKLALLTGWIQSTIQCIQDAVLPVEEGTENVRLAIVAIDQAATEQNLATTSVAAATTQLDHTIREVAEHLHTTESTVQETGRRAADGAEVSHRATDRMQELAEAVKGAAVEVEAVFEVKG